MSDQANPLGQHHYLIRGGIEGRERPRVLARCGGGDAAQGEVANVEYRVRDLTDGLGDAAYDVVYARFVLWTVQDPAGALRKMMAALRPGGLLVVEDIAFHGSYCHPFTDEWSRYDEVFTRTAVLNGGDPYFGIRLPRLMLDAGLQGRQTNIVQPAALEGDVKVLPALSLENIKTMVLQHEVASGDGVDHLVDVLYEIARDPTTYVVNPRVVQAWATDPADAVG